MVGDLAKKIHALEYKHFPRIIDEAVSKAFKGQ
jgi:hypothetical protein